MSSEPRPRPVARGREEHRHIELFPARTPTLAPATHTNSYALGERDVLLIERSDAPDAPQGEKRKPTRIEVPLVEAYVASVDIDRGVVQLVTIDGLA